MPILVETLLKPDKRPTLVRDCCTLIDEEVHAKSGLSGLAIKAAYGTVKAIKAGMISESVDGMLDDMVKNLEPFWDSYEKAGKPGTFDGYLSTRASEVADALLKISDDRAGRTKISTVRKAYEKLRPTGKKNVEQAIPRVARLVAQRMA